MTEITKDWCLNMAKAEEAAGSPEVGAGGLPETENDRLSVALNDAKRELAQTCQLLHDVYHKVIKATEDAREAIAGRKCLTGATDAANMEREAGIVRDLSSQRDRAILCGDRTAAMLIDKHILGIFWQELLDRDDRTSPEDYPEMALITREELADFINRASPNRS